MTPQPLPAAGTLGRGEVAKGAQAWQPRICPVRLSCPSVPPGMDAAPAARLVVPLTAKRVLASAALLHRMPAETSRYFLIKKSPRAAIAFRPGSSGSPNRRPRRVLVQSAFTRRLRPAAEPGTNVPRTDRLVIVYAHVHFPNYGIIRDTRR